MRTAEEYFNEFIGEGITILISLFIGFVLGVYVMYARYKAERKKRLWAEREMVNAHERILELEKEFKSNSIANIDNK